MTNNSKLGSGHFLQLGPHDFADSMGRIDNKITGSELYLFGHSRLFQTISAAHHSILR